MSAIPGWARVGAKVVCVDDGPGYIETGTMIRGGEIYTLSAVSDEFSEPACQVEGVGLRRWEFVRLSRFKPLVSQQDDITTHFEQFLHTPQKIEERA